MLFCFTLQRYEKFSNLPNFFEVFFPQMWFLTPVNNFLFENIQLLVIIVIVATEIERCFIAVYSEIAIGLIIVLVALNLVKVKTAIFTL